MLSISVFFLTSNRPCCLLASCVSGSSRIRNNISRCESDIRTVQEALSDAEAATQVDTSEIDHSIGKTKALADEKRAEIGTTIAVEMWLFCRTAYVWRCIHLVYFLSVLKCFVRCLAFSIHLSKISFASSSQYLSPVTHAETVTDLKARSVALDAEHKQDAAALQSSDNSDINVRTLACEYPCWKLSVAHIFGDSRSCPAYINLRTTASIRTSFFMFWRYCMFRINFAPTFTIWTRSAARCGSCRPISQPSVATLRCTCDRPASPRRNSRYEPEWMAGC